MWVFQNITLHRETNSAESQAKIRLVFHFIERKSYHCRGKFCAKKLKNARRKLLKLRNKHSIFVPSTAILILERNLIGADFDHVLGNHF